MQRFLPSDPNTLDSLYTRYLDQARDMLRRL